MRRLFLALTAAAALAAQAAEPPKNAALHAFFEREFTHDLREHPENATFVGVHTWNDRLTDHSPEAVARRKAHTSKVLKELERFDAKRLNTQDRISREVMLEELRRQVAFNALYGEHPFTEEDGWNVVSPMHGPHQGAAYLVRATPFATTKDFENYVKRLEGLPRMFAQLTARMRAAMKSGWMPPKAAMGAVPGMYAPYASGKPEESLFYGPFKEIPKTIPAPEGERLAAAGRRAIADQVQPAFAAFRDFLEKEYIPANPEAIAASKLPGGERYYALRVQQTTTTTMTPREIHEIGLREVARNKAGMVKLIAETGFKGSFDEFALYLRTDKKFTNKSPEERLMQYRDIAKRADAELPKLFATLPRLPYGIRAMEAFEGDNFDHYSPGALDGTRAGFFEANLNNLEKRPTWEMEWTFLHEAVPGHHLQNARAQELEGLPRFRRNGWYVAYGEGWALYAESLGYEMGFYKDPYQRFGALTGDMLRAVRLVVDTGMHALGWSRAQALDYMNANSGLHPDSNAAEVDRYIVWPGQALGYKIGQLKIIELRERSKQALGAAFDLRRYHNVILDDGALPLAVLEARVDEWIAGEKRKATRK